jgi:hypothetical protein
MLSEASGFSETNLTRKESDLIKRKARLVAQGFTQQYGVDYSETFSPTAKTASLRMLLALAVYNDWEVHQVDINLPT